MNKPNKPYQVKLTCTTVFIPHASNDSIGSNRQYWEYCKPTETPKNTSNRRIKELKALNYLPENTEILRVLVQDLTVDGDSEHINKQYYL